MLGVGECLLLLLTDDVERDDIDNGIALGIIIACTLCVNYKWASLNFSVENRQEVKRHNTCNWGWHMVVGVG